MATLSQIPMMGDPVNVAGPYLSAFHNAQDRGIEAQKRQTLSEIGAQMAGGNLSEAANTAYRGGNIDAGLKIQGMQNERQQAAIGILGKMALAADTPEKWTEYLGLIQKRFPGVDVRPFADFSKRDAVLAEFAEPGMTPYQQAQIGIAQQRLDLDRTKETDAPSGYVRNPEGKLTYEQGGPADPAVIKAQSEARGAGTRPRILPQATVSAISSAGEGVVNMDRLVGGFQDNYGGYGAAWVGNARNWVARSFGADQSATDAANWWQDYQRHKNVVRNQLFGSALTATEKSEFERADINPGMRPEVIKKNLELQQAAAKRAAKKIAGAYIKQGIPEDVIEATIGVPLGDLGISVQDSNAVDPFNTKTTGKDQGRAGDDQAMIDQANDAIAQGADPEQVKQRLRDMGIEFE